MTAFCCLCGNTDADDLSAVLGICLNATECHRRQIALRGKAPNCRTCGRPLVPGEHWPLCSECGKPTAGRIC